jgi:hypothetical protein
LLADGLTVEGAHGKKTHPAVNIERDSRLAFARILRELDLDEPVPLCNTECCETVVATYIRRGDLRPFQKMLATQAENAKMIEGTTAPTALPVPTELEQSRRKAP